MRLKSKRLISLLLAGSMMVSMVPASAVTAFAETTATATVSSAENVENRTVVEKGNCGVTGHESDVTWKIVQNNTDDSNPTYTLILSASESGQGVMADYANKTAVPYNNYLGNITIGVVEKGVKHLGARAFVLAPKLSSVELPEGLLSIGESCFNCYKLSTGLESIQFPSTLKEIGKNAFYQGKLKGAVQIPESVETIGYGAFTQCEDMTSVNLPKNLKVLGQGAFNHCGLTQMPEIPVAITTLNTTFQGCGNITEITIPSQVTDITRAFQNTGIKTVTIPCTVENYDAAFTGCTSLESVIIESPADNIGGGNNADGSGVFQGCTSLKNVTVPSWVTTIGGYAFAGCTSLSSPTFLSQIKKFEVAAFSNSGITGSIVLNATEIRERAFDKCTNLGPDICLANQATIGESAFRDCSNLNGVQYVQPGEYVHTFPNCTIKAVLNGGTIADNTAFVSGKLATPTKDGYKFVGWYTDVNDEATKLTTAAVAGNTYTAKWAELHTVTFDDGVNNSTVKVADGETVAQPADPKKDGNKFDGWYKNAAGTQAFNFETETITDNTTIYAKWTPYETKVEPTVEANADPASKTVEITVDVDANLAELDGATATLNFTDADGHDDSANVVEVKVNGTPVKKNADGKYTAKLNALMPTPNASESGADAVMLADVNADAVVSGTVKGTARLTVTYKTPGKHLVEIVLNAENGDVICTKTANVEIAPEPGTLNLIGCTATLKDGTPVENGAKVPVGAEVTVTFEQDADSDLVLNGWKVTPETLTDTNGKLVKDITADTFTFKMPETDEGVTIAAQTKAKAAAAAENDSLDAATVVTGVVLGTGTAILAYHIGTEVYAEQVLGKGVAIPRTREEVALKAWELAGKPAVELNGEPLSEAAQAEKWAVESGLMQNVDGNFNGSKKMSKLKALRTLDAAKKLG